MHDLDSPLERRCVVRWESRIAAALPGLFAFTLLWIFTMRRFDWAPWVDFLYGALWQGLGRNLLVSDPWGSLTSLHIQPPGLMGLKAINLALTPDNHQFLAVVFFLCGALSVLLVYDSLFLAGLRLRWAGVGGVVFAALPSTVIYTFFPFSTAPTVLGCALALWGVALTVRAPAIGAVASSIGVLLLLLFRTSFVWVFVLFWMAGLVWLVLRRARARRQRLVGLSGLALVAGVVIGLQAHYLASFGLWTMTSWSGENVVKALAESGNLRVTDEALNASAQLGECEGALARDLAGGNAPSWLPEHVLALPGCGPLRAESRTGVEALDSPYKDGIYDGQRAGNFNWNQRLVISRVFTRVATEVVKAEPMQMIFMAFTGGVSGSRTSGLSIYLGPSDDYGWVVGIREAYPSKTMGGLISLLFAPIAVTLTILSLLLVLLRRDGRRLRRSPTYWFALGLVGYHLAVSVLFEYGENNRFQAEVAPAWLILSAMTLATILGTRPASAFRPPKPEEAEGQSGSGQPMHMRMDP